LDEEAAHASGGPDDQDRLSLGGRERVEGGDRADPCERRCARVREVQASRFAGDLEVLGQGDQLRPTPVVHGRVGMEDEPEDLVTDSVAARARPDAFDDAGEIAAEDDRELVLHHLLQEAGRDHHVGAVYGGGVHAHEHAVVGELRLGQVVAERRLRLEALEGECSISSTSTRAIASAGPKAARTAAECVA
jgi:hypothetical protein